MRRFLALLLALVFAHQALAMSPASKEANVYAVGSPIVYQWSFLTANALPPGLSLTRSGSANYINSSLGVSSSTTNVPRVADYTSGTQRGFLVEGGATSVMLYSNGLGGTGWSGTIGGTVTQNAVISPDGTQDAILWALTGSAGNLYQYNTISNASIYTASGFGNLISGSGVFNNIIFGFTWANSVININLSTCALSSPGTAVTNYGSYIYNGWCYWYLTSTSVSGSGGVGISTPNMTESVSIWGLDMVQASYPSSVILQSSSQVPRPTDAWTASGSLATQLGAGPSIWEMKDEATGIVSRTIYAAGAFNFPLNKWVRSFAVYKAGTSSGYLNSRLNIGGAY